MVMTVCSSCFGNPEDYFGDRYCPGCERQGKGLYNTYNQYYGALDPYSAPFQQERYCERKSRRWRVSAILAVMDPESTMPWQLADLYLENRLIRSESISCEREMADGCYDQAYGSYLDGGR